MATSVYRLAKLHIGTAAMRLQALLLVGIGRRAAS
jgi:hypothetical protein